MALTSAAPAAADPRPDAIPSGPFGDMVREGQAIFHDPSTHAAGFVGNKLSCTSCHLDDGRAANSGPLGAAYVNYPAYRTKDHQVDTFAERLRGCFRYSMNGTPPPPGDKVLVALETYAFYLAKGLPVGASLPGRGYLRLAKPAQAPDFARGSALFARKCAMCHGADGAGQVSGGKTIFPALWGPGSYNWGAGMTRIDEAAGFIKADMPLGQGGSLTDQQAWDLAAFVDGHERPQDPRFTGDVAATRKAFHDTPMSLYGTTVDGVLLGARSVPPGGGR